MQVSGVSDRRPFEGTVDDGEKETQQEEEEEDDVDIDPVMKKYMMMVSEQRAKVHNTISHLHNCLTFLMLYQLLRFSFYYSDRYHSTQLNRRHCFG